MKLNGINPGKSYYEGSNSMDFLKCLTLFQSLRYLRYFYAISRSLVNCNHADLN